MKNNYFSPSIVIKIKGQFIYVGVLILLSVIISSKALAQVSSRERIIISETHSMDLYPDNDGYIKSFPVKLETKGTLVGNITCQTQGNVPPEYNHLVFILHHKDNYKNLHTKDYRNFREKVEEFDFSPCLHCGPCEYAESNIEDCFGNNFPTCGGCLWAHGVIQCP